jgi:type I restriction enzyme, S subunit
VRGPGVVTGRYGTIGQVVFIQSDFWPLNTTLFVIDFKGADPRFVAYFLRTVDFASISAKSAVPGINRNDLHEFPIVVPEPDEERRIAGVLRTLDDKIEHNEVLGMRVRDVADLQFRRTFLASRPGPRHPLAEVVSVYRESVEPAKRPGEVFEHFGIPAFDNGRRATLELGSAILSGKTRLPESDAILFSKLNPATARVWWPQPTGAGDAVCSGEFLVLIPTTVPASFLYASLRNDSTLCEEILSHATGTTGSRQRVKPSEVLACSLLDATPDELEAYDSFARPFYDLERALLRQSQRLADVRDALLPKLISGAIRVPRSYDPDDALSTVAEAAGVAVP